MVSPVQGGGKYSLMMDKMILWDLRVVVSKVEFLLGFDSNLAKVFRRKI